MFSLKRSFGWRPYMRQTSNATFRPDGDPWTRARALIEGANSPRVGRGIAFKAKKRRIRATITVIRIAGQSDPRIILADLEPEDAGAARASVLDGGWIQGRSRAWAGNGGRRGVRDPARVERRCLVLSAPPVRSPSLLAPDGRGLG